MAGPSRAQGRTHQRHRGEPSRAAALALRRRGAVVVGATSTPTAMRRRSAGRKPRRRDDGHARSTSRIPSGEGMGGSGRGDLRSDRRAVQQRQWSSTEGSNHLGPSSALLDAYRDRIVFFPPQAAWPYLKESTASSSRPRQWPARGTPGIIAIVPARGGHRDLARLPAEGAPHGIARSRSVPDRSPSSAPTSFASDDRGTAGQRTLLHRMAKSRKSESRRSSSPPRVVLPDRSGHRRSTVAAHQVAASSVAGGARGRLPGGHQLLFDDGQSAFQKPGSARSTPTKCPSSCAHRPTRDSSSR